MYNICALCVIFFGIAFAIPTARIDCGLVEGFFEDGIATFVGIPYAQAPVGNMRWKRSQSLVDANMCWSGSYNAKTYGNRCVQHETFMWNVTIGDEDCLYINVWTTNLNTSSDVPQPVMVFIHPGGLNEGSGNSFIVPSRMAKEGIVSVSFNYRLGVLGYLALQELSQSDSMGISGNYGFYDQILALKWVNKNIASFGGNPNIVTLWGFNSGGSSVYALLTSPLAKGLFHRSIIMSASPQNGVPLSDVQNSFSQNFIPRTPCKNYTGQPLLNCLYRMDAFLLTNILYSIPTPLFINGLPNFDYFYLPYMAIDKNIFSFNFTSAFTSGMFSQMPIIIGTAHDEPEYNPADIVIDMSDDEYTQYLTNKFAPWGLKIQLSKVLDAYPLNLYEDVQQHLMSMSADIHIICGNMENAIFIATKQQHLPVYFYIMTQKPSEPQCWIPNKINYCPRYSFSGWDLYTVEQNYPQAYYQTLMDQKFGNFVLQSFVQFTLYGRINSNYWRPVNAEVNFPEEYVGVLLSQDGFLAFSPKQAECRLWRDVGFDVYQYKN